MSATASPSGLRISLRELLLLFVVFAVGLAALKFANDWWRTAICGATLVAFMIAVIVAFIDRGPRQAFAIGFAACVISYAPLFMLGNEMNPYSGKLPTSHLLQPIFSAVRVQSYLNPTTGEEVLESEIPAGALVEDRTGIPPNYDPMDQRPYFTRGGSVPAFNHFMPIGHCLWTLLFGYAGGHFARWVYFRRVREQNAAAQVAAG